jgi:inner membrane protein
MPTIFSHAIAAGAVGGAAARVLTPRVVALGALLAALPDLDVIAFRVGIAYGDVLGHRGLSHSLVIAAIVAGALVLAPSVGGTTSHSRRRAFVFLFAAMASHGLLDALTDGGLGVALVSPFDTTRYFFPWRPIAVSPIGTGFFSARGLEVLRSEIVWVWLPSLAVAAAWARS